MNDKSKDTRLETRVGVKDAKAYLTERQGIADDIGKDTKKYEETRKKLTGNE